MIVGGGDQNALDVDLFLKNDSGITLHQDTKPDAHPVIICEGIENANYELHMKNAGSGDQRSLIMSAILEYR